MTFNGVRVEIGRLTANWTVTLYNINIVPAVQKNDTFVSGENVIAGQLGIDLTPPNADWSAP